MGSPQSHAWLVTILDTMSDSNHIFKDRSYPFPQLGWDVNPREWWSHKAPFNKSSHLGPRISQLGSVTANLGHARSRRDHEYVKTETTSQLSKVEVVSTSWVQAGCWVVFSKDWSEKRVRSDSSELGPDKASMRERIIWISSTETRALL